MIGFIKALFVSTLVIVGASPHDELLIRSDYKLLKSVYDMFCDNKLKTLRIEISNEPADIREKKNLYMIRTPSNRGLWIHEMMHYFSYHITGKGFYKATRREEFMCEVTENLINGVSGQEFSENFKMRGEK